MRKSAHLEQLTYHLPFRHVAVAAAAMLVALLSIGAVALAAPPPAWTSLAPVPSPGFEGMIGAGVGNQIVAAYGQSPSTGDTTDTRIYNIAANSWSSGAPAPGPARAEGTGVAHGGIVYAIGGRSATTGAVLNNLDAYDVASDTWTSLAPMPTARAGLAAAVVGNAIFAIGGRTSTGGPCSGGPLATVERYDIATNSWSAVASLPVPLSDAAAATMGGKIYVFGGCTTSTTGGLTTVSTVYVYNVQTDSWSTAAPMPRARAGFYQVGVKGDNVYVMGGLDAPFGAADGNVDVYSIAHDSWTTLPNPMPHPRGEMVVVSHGDRIYTVGGGTPAYGTSTTFNEALKP